MIYLQDLLQQVVNRVSEELTPYLQQQEYSESCTGVNFMFGHQKEIASRLARMGNSSSAFDKYPLVWLYTPYSRDVSRSMIGYEEVSCRLLFINGSKADLISEQRYDKNFKPIIHPIVESFVRHVDSLVIGRYKPFSTGDLSYEQIDHDYWGTEQAVENQLLDHLDATELNNFQFKLNIKNC